jgi:hypothetical protein
MYTPFTAQVNIFLRGFPPVSLLGRGTRKIGTKPFLCIRLARTLERISGSVRVEKGTAPTLRADFPAELICFNRFGKRTGQRRTQTWYRIEKRASRVEEM